METKPLKLMKISERVKNGHPTTSQDVHNIFQAGFYQTFGHSIEELIASDMLIKVKQDIRGSKSPADMQSSVEFIKQADITTATGSSPILNNPAAAQIGQFGGASGVFNPAMYSIIMEGVAYKTLIPKLWGAQPPASPNDLIAQLVYLSKAAPISGNSPTFARASEGRAGSDVGFELKSVNVDWGRRIVHTPVTFEVERVLNGRLPLQGTISNMFAEMYAVAQDSNAFAQWYDALDAGTLESAAFALYTDGVIADVDTMPAGYKCFYKLADGTIKRGNHAAYGSATSVGTGKTIVDLIGYIIEWMSTVDTNFRTDARLIYTPEYFVLPPKAVMNLIRLTMASSLYTAWVPKADIPMWRDESLFVGRLSFGNKSVDIWSTPDWLNLGKATTDSPTLTIYPGFAGRYQLMGATSDLTGPMTFIDPDFEVVTVSEVNVLRRRMANVHTLFNLGAERLLNASMSFLIKFLD